MDRKNENMPTGHNFRGAEKNAATNLITKNLVTKGHDTNQTDWKTATLKIDFFIQKYEMTLKTYVS